MMPMLLENALSWQVTKARGFIALCLVNVFLLKDTHRTFYLIIHVYQCLLFCIALMLGRLLDMLAESHHLGKKYCCLQTVLVPEELNLLTFLVLQIFTT